MKSFEPSYIKRLWCYLRGHKWYMESAIITFCTRCDKVRMK